MAGGPPSDDALSAIYPEGAALCKVREGRSTHSIGGTKGRSKSLDRSTQSTANRSLVAKFFHTPLVHLTLRPPEIRVIIVEAVTVN
jgi:hypothetical protein